MKKIMFLMAAAMIITGGMTATFAQEKPAVKTEKVKHEAKTEHKKTAKHHHMAKQSVKKAG